MADTVPNHFTTQFTTNWVHRIQQTRSRLEPWIEFEDYDGQRKRFDRLNKMSSAKITARKQATPITDADDDFRWAYHDGYDVANTLDEFDAKLLGPLVLPSSDYVRQHANAYLRDIDDIAWQTAINDVKTGVDGTTDTPLPAGQKIAAGGTNLTVAKLLEAREIIEAADYEDGAPRVIVCGPKQITSLLNTTEVKSSDYNTVKALAQGQIDTFMGFTFRVNNRLTFAAGPPPVRTCVCWVRGAIRMMRGSRRSMMDIIPEQRHTLQIRSVWRLGGTRLHDETVVQIDCDES